MSSRWRPAGGCGVQCVPGAVVSTVHRWRGAAGKRNTYSPHRPLPTRRRTSCPDRGWMIRYKKKLTYVKHVGKLEMIINDQTETSSRRRSKDVQSSRRSVRPSVVAHIGRSACVQFGAVSRVCVRACAYGGESDGRLIPEAANAVNK